MARGVHDKLVHRHPHVFGDVDAADADQVVSNWEAIKKSEKGRSSVTEGIPAGLPALMLTTKLARKARSVGLEPDDTGAPAETAARGVADAARRAARSRRPTTRSPARPASVSGQVGELLFAVANLAQRLGVDAEQALRDARTGVARGHPRGRRRPRPGDWQPLTLCPGVPPGRTPKE